MLIINITFILIVTWLSPYFLDAGSGFANFAVMFPPVAIDTIVIAAMVMLMIGGMFDLSVDGVVNMTGVITGALLVGGISVWLSMAAGIAAALIVGLVKGIAVTKFKMNPLMTTLGTWWVTQGLAFEVTQGLSSHSFPQRFIEHRLCRAIRRHHADLVRSRPGRARDLGPRQDQVRLSRLRHRRQPRRRTTAWRQSRSRYHHLVRARCVGERVERHRLCRTTERRRTANGERARTCASSRSP